jgi:hypothetical protein
VDRFLARRALASLFQSSVDGTRTSPRGYWWPLFGRSIYADERSNLDLSRSGRCRETPRAVGPIACPQPDLGLAAPRTVFPGLAGPVVDLAIARENLAYGNEYRGGPRVTDSDLRRMREVGLNLTDPFVDEVGKPHAMDSIIVRYAFQQAPYRCDPFAEIARILAVLDRDYSSMTLEKVSNDWESLLGLPLEKFVKAAFLILTCALFAGGRFDPAELADPSLRATASRVPKCSASSIATSPLHYQICGNVRVLTVILMSDCVVSTSIR